MKIRHTILIMISFIFLWGIVFAVQELDNDSDGLMDADLLIDGSPSDNTIIRFSEDGADDNMQSSLATIDDSGTINIPSGQTYQINSTDIISDTAYDSITWNANTAAPTKNAVRDQIEDMLGTEHCETFAIFEPDTKQGITDDIVLKHIMTDAYPNGITITDIAISASSAYTSETFLIEEWSDRAGTSQSTIESITISSQYQEDDGTLSDSDIAADAFLVVNMDDTPEDIAEVEITVVYTID